MANPDLTAERLRELLRYDPHTGLFFWLVIRPCGLQGATSLTRPAGYDRNGYVGIGIDGKEYTAHRLAWLYTYGDWPNVIDHINRIKNDNRIANLRSVTQKQNSENIGLSKNNTSGYNGVYELPSGKWNAKIKYNRKSINLGTYATKEEAWFARQEGEKRIFTHSALLLQA